MNATTILIIVNVFAALAIIVLALMQQTKGDMGSAFGGGGSSGMFGAKGSANFLSRCTSAMCAVFFISSLALAYIYAQRGTSNSVVEPSVIEQSSDSEVPTIETDVSTEGDVPTIEADTSVPSVDVPESIEAAADDAVEQLEAASEEVPAVPEEK